MRAMNSSDYENQAKEFLYRFGLSFMADISDNQSCPPWGAEKPCNHLTHGRKYNIGFMRRFDQPSLEFNFWGSKHDQEDGKHPTAYDVLSCISSDASQPEDPDEVYAEYGNMKPSQCIAIAEFSKKLKQFFSKEELEALAEIQ